MYNVFNMASINVASGREDNLVVKEVVHGWESIVTYPSNKVLHLTSFHSTVSFPGMDLEGRKFGRELHSGKSIL
nr:hypothetical protein CFP56_18519 [Quercus suber]